MVSLRSRQCLIFCVGWISYAATYFLRKPLGIIKTDLLESTDVTKNNLGWLDTALLAPYALMQIGLSGYGDIYGARLVLSFSLVLSGFSMISFGIWNSFYMFSLLLFINGTAQSQCWPNSTKILGSWFSDASRNSVFGLYGTCAFAGGVIGTALGVHLQISYGWRYVFFLPSCLLMILGLLVFFLYKEPLDVGVVVPGRSSDSSVNRAKNALSYKEIFAIPGVTWIALSVFCLKLVRYCMYMWLPLYLLRRLEYSKAQAGIFSTAFEVGGVVGSALIGIIIDRCCHGNHFRGVTLSVLLSAFSLLAFSMTSSMGMMVNVIFLALAGAFNCGPDSILGGAIPTTIGDKDGRNSGSAVTGFVNGFGSLGTIIEGPLIGYLSSLYGWDLVFYLMIILSFAGVLTTLKASVDTAKNDNSRVSILL